MRCGEGSFLVIVLAAIAALEGIAGADPTAEDHFNAGQAAYDRGDFPTAIREWQTSLQISGERALIFNIAQAQRLSGDCPRALATYRHYLATAPAADQRTLAEDWARDLGARCSAPLPATPEAQGESGSGLNLADRLHDHEDGGRRPGRKLKIAGLVTSGAGAAVLTTGLLLGNHASSIGARVTAACRTSCDWETWKGQDAQGRRDASIGTALDVVGTVGLAGGVALYYLGMREGGVSVAPRPHDGGAVVTWNGTW